MSSQYEPVQIMRPSRIMMIRDASLMVLRRCAMETDVIFLRMGWRLEKTDAYVQASSALVLQSNNNRRGLRDKHRAMANLCFCPPEICEPFCPTSFCKPYSHCQINLELQESWTTSSSCYEERSRLYLRFYRTVPRNIVGSWLTIPICLLRWQSQQSLMFLPSMKISPEFGSQRRMSNCRTVDFPLPDSPTRPIFSPSFIFRSNSQRTELSRSGYLKEMFLNQILPFRSSFTVPPFYKDICSSSLPSMILNKTAPDRLAFAISGKC